MFTNPSALQRYTDYQRYNFNREPHWRWERIEFLNSQTTASGNRRRCSTRDDRYIREGRPLVEAARRLAITASTNDADAIEQERILWRNPALHYAHVLFEQVESAPETTLYLQARLLAGQTNQEISKIMGISEDTVEWYEALFFDVRQFRECRDWITTKVLIPAMRRMAPPEDASPAFLQHHDAEIRDDVQKHVWQDGSLKMFAYFGGPMLIDIMLAQLTANNPLRNSEDFDNWMDGNWKKTIRKRSGMAAMQFRINKYNVMQLFDTHARIMELEVSKDSSEESRTANEKGIKAMLDEIPWAIGDEASSRFKGTVVGKFDEGASELRDSELIMISAGDSKGPTDMLEELPPPRRNKLTVSHKDEDL